MSKEFKLYDADYNHKTMSTAKLYFSLQYDEQTRVDLDITKVAVNGEVESVFAYMTIETYTYYEDNCDLVLNTRRKYSKTYDPVDFPKTDLAIKEIENSINQNNLDFEQLGFTLEGVEIYD